MRTIFKPFTIPLVFVILVIVTLDPTASASRNMSSSTMQQLIGVHSDLRSGILPVGIPYHILPCPIPKDSLELRLLVNIGSLSERDEESGFAHFIEHLGFGFKMVRQLETLGVVYGPDLNAATGQLETKFRLSLTCKNETFDERFALGIKILLEWALLMEISHQAVEEEKPIILAEYRAKQGLNQRLLRTYWDRVFGSESIFAKRFPIGKPEVFLNAATQTLQNFYDKWYRPENMAIMIVGDVKDRLDSVMQILHATGSDPSLKTRVEIITNQCEPTTETMEDTEYLHARSVRTSLKPFDLEGQMHHSLAFHDKDEVFAIVDQELTTSQVTIEFFRPAPVARTMEYVRYDVMLRLLASIVDRRLHRLSKGLLPNGLHDENCVPFLSAGISIRQLIRGLSCIGITATLSRTSTCMPGSSDEYVQAPEEKSAALQSTRKALYGLLLEMRRMQEVGLLPEELEVAKGRWADVFMEKKRTDSRVTTITLANDLETHILSNKSTVFASQSVESELHLEALKMITLADMQDFVQQLDMHVDDAKTIHYFKKGSNSFRLLYAQYPDSASVASPPLSDETLANLLQKTRTDVEGVETLEQWSDRPMLTPTDVIEAAKSQLLNSKRGFGMDDSVGPPEDIDDAVYCADIGTNVSSNASLVSQLRNWRLCEEGNCSRADVNNMVCNCSADKFLPPSMQSIQSTPAVAFAKGPVGANINATMSNAALNLSTSHLSNISATEVRLSNGITVALKWFKEQSPNKISMQAFALGGSSELSEVEETTFSLLDEVAGSSGFAVKVDEAGLSEGTHNQIHNPDTAKSGNGDMHLQGQAIKDLQETTKTRVNTQRHHYHRGIGGSCPTHQIELLLAMIHLKLTAQHIDPVQVERSVRRQAEHLTYRDNSPEAYFMERARILCVGDIPICRPLTLQTLDSIDPMMAKDLYMDAFMQDPREFTFVFIGDLPPVDDLFPLLETYLGSLAPVQHADMVDDQQKSRKKPWARRRQELQRSTNNASSCIGDTILNPSTDNAIHLPFTLVQTNFPHHRVRESIPKRLSDKTSTLMVFQAKLGWNDINDMSDVIALDAACRILQRHLLELLRVRLGKVYSVVVETSRNSLSPVSLISIVLDSDSVDVGLVHDAMAEQIAVLHSQGPDEAIVQAIREAMLQQISQSLSSPSHWLFWILDAYKALRVHQFIRQDGSTSGGNDDDPHVSSASVATSDVAWVNAAAARRSTDKAAAIKAVVTRDVIWETYERFFSLDRYVLLTLEPLKAANTYETAIEQNASASETRHDIGCRNISISAFM